MSRADDCAEVNGPHLKHVPVCQRTGYANGRADALDEVEQAIAALVAEIEGLHSWETDKDVLVEVEGGRATVLEDVEYCGACGELEEPCRTVEIARDAQAKVRDLRG